MTTQVSGRKYIVEVYIDGPEYNLSKLSPPKESTSERIRTRRTSNPNASVSNPKKVRFSKTFDVMNAGTSEGRRASTHNKRQQPSDEIEPLSPTTKRRKVILYVNRDSPDRKYITRTTSGRKQLPSGEKDLRNRIESLSSVIKSEPISPPVSSQSTISTGESIPDDNVPSASQRLLHMTSPSHSGGLSNLESSRGCLLDNREDAIMTDIVKSPSKSRPDNKEKLTIKIPPASSLSGLKQSSQISATTELRTPLSPLFEKRKSASNYGELRSPGVVNNSSTLGITNQSTGVATTEVVNSTDNLAHLLRTPLVDSNTMLDELSQPSSIIPGAAINADVIESQVVDDQNIVKLSEFETSRSGNLAISSQMNLTEVAQDDAIDSAGHQLQATHNDTTILLSDKLIDVVEDGQRPSLAVVDADTSKAISMSPIIPNYSITTRASSAPIIDENVLSMTDNLSCLPSSTSSEKVAVASNDIVTQSCSTNSTQSTPLTLTASNTQNSLSQSPSIDGDVNTPLTSRADTPSTCSATVVGVSPDGIVKAIDSTQAQSINVVLSSENQPWEHPSIKKEQNNTFDFSNSKLPINSSQKDHSCDVMLENLTSMLLSNDFDSDEEDLGELEYPDWDPSILASQAKFKYTIQWD